MTLHKTLKRHHVDTMGTLWKDNENTMIHHGSTMKTP